MTHCLLGGAEIVFRGKHRSEDSCPSVAPERAKAGVSLGQDVDVGADGGWTESARAYIDFQDKGDPNRTILLDPVMLRLCGDVAGRRVLDLGCGEGRFCRMLAAQGAETIGVDLIREMVATALERDENGQRYVQASAEALPSRTRPSTWWSAMSPWWTSPISARPFGSRRGCCGRAGRSWSRT